MSNNKLALMTFALAFAVTGSQLTVSARGGGYYHEPKETRQTGLWYGDAFVSEEDKKATYANYHGSSKYYGTSDYATQAIQPNQGWGNTATATPAAAANQTQAANNLSTPVGFSGPAYVGPTNYHYFVQEYDWKRP